MSSDEGAEFDVAVKVLVGEYVGPKGCHAALIMKTNDLDIISLLDAEEARSLAAILISRAEQLELVASLERDLG